MRNPILTLKPGAVYEGVQLVTISYSCDECPLTYLVTLGPLETIVRWQADDWLEVSLRLAEIDATHECSPPAEPRVCTEVVTPY